jgi:hypothetical protein
MQTCDIKASMRAFLSSCLFVVLGVAWLVVDHLLDHAVTEWIDQVIADRFGLTSPSVGTVLRCGAELSPPIVATAIILGIYHIWHDNRLKQRALHPTPETSGSAKPEEIADMPIQDVFSYIDADVLENDGSQRVGQELLDLLSTGALDAYGREGHFGVGRYHGYPNLALIPRTYWKTARFTYQFFGADREQDVHVETKHPSTGPTYRDVRFSSSQIKRRWTKSQPEDRIFAMKAIYLIVTQSEWAKNLVERPDSMQPVGLHEKSKSRKALIKDRLLATLRRDIHDRLRSGEIQAWARRDRHRPLAPIKPEEWDNIHITTDEIDFRNLNNGFCTQNAPLANRTTCYENVQFVRSQIMKSYPLLHEPIGFLEDSAPRN